MVIVMRKAKTFNTKDLILTAVFAALTAILAQISIPIPISPVPLSLSLVAIFLCGGILKPQYAFSAMIVYILLGIAGIPVFGQFKAGIGHIVGPTGGYIIAYPLMAIAISLILKYVKKPSVFISAAAMAISLIICYGLGSAWLAIFIKKSFFDAILIGVAPYVIFDLVKAVVSSIIVSSVKKRAKFLI